MAISMAALGSRRSWRPWLRHLMRTPSPSAVFSTQSVSKTDNIFTVQNSPAPSTFDHTPILATPATKITVLPNGLRVATESHLAMQTATLGVWIDAGSRFESASNNGTAHFLEHMIFKGTKKRSVQQLEEGIENIGGHLNAYTSREQTAYYAKVTKSHVGCAVDLLSDILQNSSFSQDRIERERSVILREMQEVEGQCEEVIFDHLHATAFQHTPLGRTILGPAENIRSITKQHLADYISTHYTAPRMVIVGAGAVEHKDVVELAGKYFTCLSTDARTSTQLIEKEPAVFTGSEVRIRDDDMPLAHFAVAVMGASWTDPDSVALMVMQTMLGGWNKNSPSGKHMGSELAQKIAANELAESFTAFNTNYSDAGLFGVYAVTKPEKLDDLSWAIMHEVGRLIYRATEDDVIRARNQKASPAIYEEYDMNGKCNIEVVYIKNSAFAPRLKSSLLLHLDGTSAIAEDIGRQILVYGRRLPIAELFARIDAVDAETVKRVANRFIYDKEIAITAMGPTQYLPDYNWFRRRTYWLRY